MFTNHYWPLELNRVLPLINNGKYGQTGLEKSKDPGVPKVHYSSLNILLFVFENAVIRAMLVLSMHHIIENS